MWTIGVTELKPKRNAVNACFFQHRGHWPRIPGLESALTRDLRAALVEGVDRAIFLGDSSGGTGTASNIVGLQTAANVVEKELIHANQQNQGAGQSCDGMLCRIN